MASRRTDARVGKADKNTRYWQALRLPTQTALEQRRAVSIFAKAGSTTANGRR